MTDFVLTGASRGIGRATALAAARPGDRWWLLARDEARLSEVARHLRERGAEAEVVPADLSSVEGSRRLGLELAARVPPGSVLVHDAGLWPSRLEVGEEGLEQAFVVNHLAPLALQAPLVDAGRLSRVLVVGAGLMALGRFDPARTPTGADFSAFRTYASTKLAFAVAMRDVAARHPELDVLVVHPGVVRSELGARPGLLGWLLSQVKRRWEPPEACGARLARILSRPRWAEAGVAAWQLEEEARPWPKVADDPETRAAVIEVTSRLLGSS